MTRGAIELEITEASNIEARLVARFHSQADEPIVLRGTLRGPYCEQAHTLPAKYPFRNIGQENAAEAVVPDPCLWSTELPHFYQADVEAVCGEKIVAEYHGKVGLRRTGPAKIWE